MTDNKKQEIKLNIDAELNSSEITGNVEPQRTNKSRRTALLGAIGVAGAASLPSEWKKPVIDGLVLPAHAQMSPSVMTQSSVTTIQQSQSGTVAGTAYCSKYQTRLVDFSTSYYSDGISGVYVSYSYAQATVCRDTLGGSSFVISTYVGGEGEGASETYSIVGNATNYFTSNTYSYTVRNFGPSQITFEQSTSFTVEATTTTSVTVSA